MQLRTILLIGPQGSGKGTQLERLRQRLESSTNMGVLTFQSGSLFRSLAEESSTTALRLRETLNSGILQPLFLSVGLWGNDMVNRMDETSHVLIDGFPRIALEAEVLTTALRFYGRTNVDVVVLEAPEDVVRERMHKRARHDDTPEAIEKRLHWYRTETEGVLAYLATMPFYSIHRVSALESIEVVETTIADALAI